MNRKIIKQIATEKTGAIEFCESKKSSNKFQYNNDNNNNNTYGQKCNSQNQTKNLKEYNFQPANNVIMTQFTKKRDIKINSRHCNVKQHDTAKNKQLFKIHF